MSLTHMPSEKPEKERRALPKKSYHSVTFKLLTSVFAVVLLIIAVQTGLNLYNAQRQNEAKERQKLSRLYSDYQHEVQVLKRTSAALAVSFADREDVQTHVATGDRQALLQCLTPVFDVLRAQYGIVHLYIHQANGAVFLRVHDPEHYGDSITPYRQINAIALETHQPIAGVELDPDRLGVRGIAPIFQEQRFIGLVEVGLDYDQAFLASLETRHNADYTLWVTFEAAAPTGLWPQGDEPPAPSSELFYYASTRAEPVTLPESVYLNVLQHGKTEHHLVADGKQELAVLVAPLYSFAERVIGIVEISVSRTEALADLRKNQLTTVLLAGGLALVALTLMWASTHSVVLRVLRHLTTVAQRQLEGDWNARVTLLPNDEFGRLGHTFNRLTEQLNASINKLEHQVDMLQRAERALAHEQYLMRALMDTVPDHIYFKDTQSRFIRMNQAQAKRFNLSNPSAALGKTDFDFFSKEHAQRAYEDEQAIIQTGKPLINIEEKETWPDSSVTWVSTTKMPLMDEDEQIIGIFGISRDITNYKRNQAHILRLQHLLQNITDSMPSALIALDTQGHVLLWNPAAEALTGCAVQDVIGQRVWQVCSALARYRELFTEVLHKGKVVHQHKEPVLTDDTALVYRNVDVFPLRANSVSGAVLRIDDITQQVQLEEMMLQSAKMASVGGLAAGMAHEINNPLGAMIQSAQILQMALDTERSRTQERLCAYGIAPNSLRAYLQSRSVDEYLQGIRDTGARAAKIVSDLLNFSRKSTSKFKNHNLNQLIEQTLALAVTDYDLKKRYDFKEMDIIQETLTTLPDIVCDGQQIQQVILNLVRNAAQAMAEKKATWADTVYQPRLIIRTQQPDADHVRLEVVDNGPGLPNKVNTRLFEPFVTTKDIGEGTGLGLWLCWSIVVERHKGRIWAESTSEDGTRFIVDLPIVQDGGETLCNPSD